MPQLTPLEADVEDVKEPDGLTRREVSAVREHLKFRAAVVYEIIRAEGESELSRRWAALWWSGIAAGLSIGFSFLAEAWLAAVLPMDQSWSLMVSNLGYSVGFLIVILARQQLFTENTLTAVLPVIARRTPGWFAALGRLWGTVLAANVVGCAIFALFVAFTPSVSAEVTAELKVIAKHMMENSAWEMFIRGIVAGWLIAALVWMLPSSEGGEFALIILITYLIALGDLTHIVAGSAEALYLVFLGDETMWNATFQFFFPTLAGNVFGGTLLFAVLSYVQVREEIDPAR
ncbi:MAG: formate/nitrite transporter family protein [Pseudomonadota bacterium]